MRTSELWNKTAVKQYCRCPVVGYISRVRTSMKLKQNETVDGRLKRSPDRRQFCFISVLFHHVRRAG